MILDVVFILLEIEAIIEDYSYHYNVFIYYTQDSNYLALAGCILYAVFAALALRNGSAVPYAVRVFKYVGLCCLLVTFVVVFTVLIPFDFSIGQNGFKSLLWPAGAFFHHLVCPVLLFVSFVIFDNGPKLPKQVILFALIPTLIYAAVFIILNIARIIEGPYPFLMVYRQSVFASIMWVIAILGIAALLAWATQALHGKLQ